MFHISPKPTSANAVCESVVRRNCLGRGSHLRTGPRKDPYVRVYVHGSYLRMRSGFHRIGTVIIGWKGQR
jgi:hypothetical protein